MWLSKAQVEDTSKVRARRKGTSSGGDLRGATHLLALDVPPPRHIQLWSFQTLLTLSLVHTA